LEDPVASLNPERMQGESVDSQKGFIRWGLEDCTECERRKANLPNFQNFPGNHPGILSNGTFGEDMIFRSRCCAHQESAIRGFTKRMRLLFALSSEHCEDWKKKGMEKND